MSPLTMPWEGIAAHGDTPFSCMLISHIEGNLWVGGCIDRLKLPDDFEYVVSVYPWEKYRIGPDTKRFEFEVYDAEMDNEGVIWEAVKAAVACVHQGKTLVHCQAGLNRSGLVATLVLREMGYTIPEAILLLRDRRTTGVLCNPHFVEYLLGLEYDDQ